MKSLSLLILGSVFSLISFVGPVQATIVVVEYAGSVSTSRVGGVSVGDAVLGRFTYDTLATNLNSQSENGRYRGGSASMTVNGLTWQFAGGSNHVLDRDGTIVPFDVFQLFNGNGTGNPDVIGPGAVPSTSTLDVTLVSDWTFLTSALQPTAGELQAMFDNNVQFRIHLALIASEAVFADINSISISEISEPTALLLLSAGLAGLGLFRRRIRS